MKGVLKDARESIIEMPLHIVQTLRTKPGYEAARLIGSMSQFITDTNLINIMNQYDLNSKAKDKTLILQIGMFDGVPGLQEQVTKWLSS